MTTTLMKGLQCQLETLRSSCPGAYLMEAGFCLVGGLVVVQGVGLFQGNYSGGNSPEEIVLGTVVCGVVG